MVQLNREGWHTSPGSNAGGHNIKERVRSSDFSMRPEFEFLDIEIHEFGICSKPIPGGGEQPSEPMHSGGGNNAKPRFATGSSVPNPGRNIPVQSTA